MNNMDIEIRDQIKSQLKRDKTEIVLLSLLSVIFLVTSIIVAIAKERLFLIFLGASIFFLIGTILTSIEHKKHSENCDAGNYHIKDEEIYDKILDDDACYIKFKDNHYRLTLPVEQYKKVDIGDVVKVIYFEGEEKPFTMLM